ncbi:unnamed protein product [Acanthoscelides obtectus]|uniref:Uncharacterized protein n=1 Tax=Acanthoscelides obtectus TaxID=200917 RepID=A0A9P0KD12_ACAOB|nr:unnamed protein product [Acanthoscelides obtectus]CAK1677240.1 Cyclic nucleotide-gated cation channel beta-1 [Acanthoscelides obtectus]
MVFPEKLLLDQVQSKSSENSLKNWCSEKNTSNMCQVIEAPNGNRMDNPEDDFQEGRFKNNTNFEEANRKFIQDRIRHLVDAFSTRAEAVKEVIKSPATPSSAVSQETLDQDQPPSPKPKLSISFANKYDVTPKASLEELDHPYTFCDSGVIDPNEKFYIVWMSIASISVLYNGWVILLRSTFPYQTPQNRAVWMTFDYVADTIYFADMIFIQPRIQYLQDGFWVTDRTLLRNRYMKSVSSIWYRYFLWMCCTSSSILKQCCSDFRDFSKLILSRNSAASWTSFCQILTSSD